MVGSVPPVPVSALEALTVPFIVMVALKAATLLGVNVRRIVQEPLTVIDAPSTQVPPPVLAKTVGLLPPKVK